MYILTRYNCREASTTEILSAGTPPRRTYLARASAMRSWALLAVLRLVRASSLLLTDSHRLPSLDPKTTELPFDQLLFERAAAASVEQHIPPATWQAVAHRLEKVGTLHVAVLGMSTTSGCGVKTPEVFCDPDESWARRMHDGLALALHAMPNRPRLQSQISFKAAVSPLFYTSCISEYVPPKTDIVLLEVVQNIVFDSALPSIWDGVRALLQALRRAAPRAAVAFVALPQPNQLGLEAFWQPLRQLAAEHKCDLIHTVPAMQPSLPVLEHEDISSWPASRFALDFKASDVWYAYRGGCKNFAACRDHHPNPMGHQLMAMLAVSHIRRRLRDAATQQPSTGRHRSEINAEPTGSSVLREKCFAEGQLPMSKGSTGFELRDEGARGKGVRKAGLVSNRVGDMLRIGPLQLHELGVSRECAVATSRLGYFATTYPGQGDLHLSCHGCVCSAFNDSSRFREGFLPFPRVSTNNALHIMGTGKNYSGTSTTVFHTTMRRDVPCYVVVRHTRSRLAHHDDAPSHVRVDSFALSAESSLASSSEGAVLKATCGQVARKHPKHPHT